MEVAADADAVAAAPPPAPDSSSLDAAATTLLSASIRALPQSSRSLISSDQLLLGPASFVRELLDNALDAGATNIQLTLSADASGAIDTIEVCLLYTSPSPRD